MSATKATFPHRLNADGTYDFILPELFSNDRECTVAGDLAPLENAHVCHSDSFLAERRMFILKAS